MFGLTKRRQGNGATALARRSEWPLTQLRDEFDAMFDRFFRGWPALAEQDFGPFWDLDVDEKDNEVVVRAEAPGFDPGDFDINLSGDMLSIKAEHKAEKEEKKGDADYWERRHSRFERSISLPAGTDPEKVEAQYRNGVLELHIARTPGALPKRIQVRA